MVSEDEFKSLVGPNYRYCKLTPADIMGSDGYFVLFYFCYYYYYYYYFFLLFNFVLFI